MAQQIDARGPRFGAAITTVVLAAAFLTVGTTTATVLLVIQALAFGAGSIVGLAAQPYGWVFRKFVRPRLSGPIPLEAPQPPRFAQAVGLGFALAALVGVVLGSTVVTSVGVGFALVAAVLNAAFGFCLGCEIYLLLKRLTSVPAAAK